MLIRGEHFSSGKLVVSTGSESYWLLRYDPSNTPHFRPFLPELARFVIFFGEDGGDGAERASSG